MSINNSFFNLKNLALILLLAMASFFLMSCQKSPSSKRNEPNTFIVSEQNEKTPLYFTGFIKPLHVFTVLSPVDGTIATTAFHYGNKVSLGQLVLSLSSIPLTKDYQSALTNFVTAKQKYADSKNSMASTQYLYKVGLIAKNDYLNAISNLNDAQLNYIQGRVQLEKILKLINIPIEDIEFLTIGQTKAIENDLQKTIGNIPVKANASGIALLPPKQSSSDDSSNSSIQVGSEVKAGQALLSIGDMSGIAIHIEVDEININQIKPGFEATVTSPAFPNFILKGYVSEVSAQAKVQQSGGLPTFAVKIIVPNINSAEQKKIHVGMSAEVTILIKHTQTITLPISAVSEKHGIAFVQLLDKKTHNIVTVSVKTGATSLNGIQIVSGLKPGDEVVLSH